MRSKIVGVSLACLAGTLAFAPFAAFGGDLACESCPPGPHFIDACAGGVDQMSNSDAMVSMDVTLDCIAEMSAMQIPCAMPAGLLVVSRSDPRDDSQNYPGLRALDGHMDVVDTEVLSACLIGGGGVLRIGMGQGGVILPSLGALAELPGNPWSVQSFFDIYFELSLDGGMTVYNQMPLRMAAEITCVPPSAVFTSQPGVCLELFTSPVPGLGDHIGNLITAEHGVNNGGPTPVESISWGRVKSLFR